MRNDIIEMKWNRCRINKEINRNVMDGNKGKDGESRRMNERNFIYDMK